MRADFDLHIKLLADMNRSGRMHLENHKFTIQQDIEELLRLAAAGDFADPRLVEIKRQLQEQINQTLTKRVIEDVIITNLVVIRAEDATAAQNVPKKKNIQAPKAQSTNPQWEQPTAEAES